jgi:hypothetical protein
MKQKQVMAPLAGALLVALSQVSLAQDPFHISYRQQSLTSDGLTQSGVLLVTVVNVSGEDVRDVVASVPGPNNVTYDNRTLRVGDLAEGAQSEVLDQFQVPQELANPAAIEDQITWFIEYTDSAGERQSAEVNGERVPE